MHGSGIRGRDSRAPVEAKLMWSAPVITDITNDEAEQIAAMRRMPKTKKRGGDVDWGNAFEEDRQLYVALLIKWQSLCRNCILHTVRDKNGSVPYKHRANIKTFDDDSLRGADTDEDAQGPAAGIDGIDQIKKPKQADYGETDDACFARANKDKPVYSADEFEPIGGVSLGFDSLISKIPDMIHSAARSFARARGG